MSSTVKKSAEQEFRDAFDRLKKGKTIRLPLGAAVTQNNVAREAGRDPSALKKDRYPLLILEVQAYITSKSEQKRSSKRTTDNRARTDKQKIADYRKQIDRLSSIVAAQNSTIEELLDEIERLKAGRVSRF
ncbi:hypothetical protein V6D52_08885 [Idiomarina loihiensis]|uniref:Uncharacterized protein n=3 Tax=Gammaproteobacteria TaxID=1236 RepID=A0A7Z0LX94_9GAMM|nr:MULTISPECIES: hypothetical protein [Gammaproteobacteria]AEF05712.1 hypothetical protein ambt_21105 [Alteromonas naphthalenivorans]NWO03103.1 hypothetical protein [Idiomarinaceae bacterium]NYS80259.1 hypothetical protein [Halomonas glaciei]OUX92362.1 MAG: hypothetical protein CBB95_00260 [Alteromonas sp. TMED35]